MHKIKMICGDTLRNFHSIMISNFMVAFGIFILLNVGKGMDSWSVLSEGVAVLLGVSLGLANTLIGLITFLLSIKLKEIPGITTVFSIFLVGLFLDLFRWIGFTMDLSHFTFWQNLPIILVANVVIAFGIAYYISIGLGAGSRDAVFVWFLKLLPLPVALSKIVFDFTVIALGVLLGGTFGYGTIITLIVLGPMLDVAFRILKTNPRTLIQKTFLDYEV